MGEVKIIITSDGSHSLFNTELNETYHSIHGAIQESVHVFIKNGLDYLAQRNSQTEIKILEVGFGTGLNALLTLQYSLEHLAKISYESLEAFPIENETAMQLNYPNALSFPQAEKYFLQLHQSPWDEQVEISNTFSFHKRHIKLEEANLVSEKFDLIYFDAFAPSKQPEMWGLPIFEKIERSMKSGGVLVTYCAKGQFKRDLKSLGLKVESLPGPPGKFQMVRALKS